MDDEVLDSLSGQIAAISSTISALIAVLPPEMARRAAQGLEADRCVLLEEDGIQDKPVQHTATREAILSAYVDLLRAVGKRG